MFDVAYQVERQRCSRCGRRHSPWDGVVHQSVFAHLPGIPVIKGEVYLFCVECDEADSFYVDWQGMLSPAGRIGVDGPVPTEWLSEEIGRQEFEAYVSGVLADPDALQSFKIRVRLFASKVGVGGAVWSFNSPRETWAELRGRGGFALTSSGGGVVCSLVTELN